MYSLSVNCNSMRDAAFKMHGYYSIVIIFTLTLAITYEQKIKVQDDCGSKETCTDCIRIRNCTWCDIMVDETMDNIPLRCVNMKDLILEDMNKWCTKSGGKIVNHTTNADLFKNDPLGSENDKQVQIQPQIVNLKLRQGEEYRLNLRYRQAKDFPVDLYFLVDFSYSMTKSKDDLSKLTGKITEAMQNLTSNFQLGFGSFVDKKIRPMIRDGSEWNWSRHDAFQNHLPLTHEYKKFTATVLNTPTVPSPPDLPESGLDGMMQAIVCTKEIGWRPNARHLLVHVSDSRPHIAGDGRLAGLVNPNDEKCHLENGTGLYTHGELQDYPSLGQINWQARKNNINIIFATLTEDEKSYQELQNVIENSAVGTFDIRSNKIVSLISGQYEKLARSLRMTSNCTSNLLDIEFFSSCLAKNEEPQRRNTCNDTRVNVTIEFDVLFKAKDCSKREEEWHQIIEIKPEGINERVIVNVELICDCECSKKIDEGETSKRSEECHHNGIFNCGVCSCDKGFYGKSCQCEGDEDLIKTDPFMTVCRKDNSSEICSGRGKCLCGNCSCQKRQNSDINFNGTYCECDDFDCGKSKDGKLCGENGYCECGNCKCNSGWSGPICECRDDKFRCFSPGEYNNEICSSAGECKCGECICDKKKKRSGRLCEDCPGCPSKRCEEFKDCVECQIHKSGKIYAIDRYCRSCDDFDIHVRDDQIEENPDKRKPGYHLCDVAGDDGSTFVFTYVYLKDGDKDPKIYAEKDKNSRWISDLLAATLGGIFLTLLIGLLILLIWKITTCMQDKREFEKFEKERAQVHWAKGQNPLYKMAVTTFKNPIFDSTLEDEVIIMQQTSKRPSKRFSTSD